MLRLERMLRWLTALPLLVVLTACETADTTAPVGQPSMKGEAAYGLSDWIPGLGGRDGSPQTEMQSLRAVKRTQTQTADYTTSKVIGRLGGVIAGAGVQLVIPPLALKEDVLITLTVPRGDFMDVRFEPHGLQFRLPAILSLSLVNTEAGSNRSLLNGIIGVYHNDDAEDGSLDAEETFGLQLNGFRAIFPIEHFSSYSVGFRRGFILVGA